MIALTSLPFFALLKITVFDKQPLALAVYSIDLELEGFETPEESSIVNETFTPSPKGFKISVTL